MTNLLTVTDLANAKLNANTLDQFTESNLPTATTKNGKVIKTIQGVLDEADTRFELALRELGYTGVGNYGDNVTLTAANEMVQFTDDTWWAANDVDSLPFAIDSATYPNPANHVPALKNINQVTQGFVYEQSGYPWIPTATSGENAVPNRNYAFGTGSSRVIVYTTKSGVVMGAEPDVRFKTTNGFNYAGGLGIDCVGIDSLFDGNEWFSWDAPSGNFVSFTDNTDYGTATLTTSDGSFEFVSNQVKILRGANAYPTVYPEAYPEGWGASADGVTNDSAAFQLMIDEDIRNITLRDAIYAFSVPIDMKDKVVSISGAGIGKSILLSTSATQPVILNTQLGKDRSIKGVSFRSSVAKTGGAMIDLLAEKEMLIEDVEVRDHFDGIVFRSYEVCHVVRTQIVAPSGYGTGLQAGVIAAAAVGAGLFINDCLIRGAEIDGSNRVGKYGLAIYDADAVNTFQTDIGGMIDHDLYIAPSVRAANCYFLQTWFDATENNDCVRIEGDGNKLENQFTSCWFSSAGKLGVGGTSAESCGLRMQGSGGLRNNTFSDCLFFNNSGNGFMTVGDNASTFTNPTVTNNGVEGVTNIYGALFEGATSVSPRVLGGKFEANKGADIYLATGNVGSVTQGGHYEKGIGGPGKVNSATVASVGFSTQVASSVTISVSPLSNFYTITGGQNIAGILTTFTGHEITLRFTSPLTVIDASQNLRLAGHLGAADGTILTLICDGAEWFELSRSINGVP